MPGLRLRVSCRVMSSCAHFPLVRDVRSVTYSTPLLSFSHFSAMLLFFLPEIRGNKYRFLPRRFGLMIVRRVKRMRCMDPGVHRQSASLHHQPSLVRMWSINNRTLKHLCVLQPAARSLQKEDPQQTEQNPSMSSFRTTQSRRAKRALLRSFSRITDRAMRVLFF